MDTSIEAFFKKAHEINIKINELLISKICFSILSAIKYLSNLGIIHNDIKPSNILINKTGQVKLCDFGASIDLNHKNNPQENLNNDVWSLGILIVFVFYFLLEYLI